ncbi:MAG: 50S ribosomal protein L30 [Terriglobia bacterium]
MAEKTLKTIRIKWVRSGIGFTYHQKTIVRSLGLTKLNHSVVRPDTPQIRGIVAAVPHMLEIIPEPVAPAWASIPEYTVHPPAAAAAATAESEPAIAAEDASEAVVAQAETPQAEAATEDQKQESSPKGSEPTEASKE